MPNIYLRAKAALQAFRFPGGRGDLPSYFDGSFGSWLSSSLSLLLPGGGEGLDWEKMAGRLDKSSAVTPFLNYARRKFPECPPVVMRETADGIGWADHNAGGPVAGHALAKLVRKPNPYYGYSTLVAGTLLSRMVSGNAYWFKVRDGYGAVTQLWYVPHFYVHPRWDKDSTEFLTHYDYVLPDATTGQNRVTRMETTDVVHIRQGIDPDNVRLGLSDLAAMLRAVGIMNEADVYLASILKNFGIPGLMIAPDTGVTISENGAKAMKEKVRDATTGAKRGEPIVIPDAVKVTTLGFSPEQLALDRFLDIPATSISAALGIPAMALGLNVGEKQKTFSNAREAREQAVEDWLLPTARDMADDIDASMRLDFKLADNERFAFYTGGLRELQPDVNARRSGLVLAVGGAFLTVNEARGIEGLDPIPGGDELIKAPVSEPKPKPEDQNVADEQDTQP